MAPKTSTAKHKDYYSIQLYYLMQAKQDVGVDVCI